MCKSWEAALRVIHILKSYHHEAYIVGGAVRDRLLHRDIADVDVATTARASEVEQLFEKTFRMNNDHETVIVRVAGEHIEVTTMRGKSIEADLECRDLTINSIAQNETILLDPLGGIRDLEKGMLRSHNPEKRMSEDPLRMLRVYRFKSELDFVIDEALEQTMIQKGELLQHVAVERIVKEWIKLLKGKARNNTLIHMKQSGLYKYIPKLQLTKEIIGRLCNLPPLQAESELFCWFIFCLCQDSRDVSSLKRLALSNELLNGIRLRLRFSSKRQTEDWSPYLLYHATLPVALDVEKGRRFLGLPAKDSHVLKRLWNELPIKSKGELAITGKDLAGIRPPGPWIKEELEWGQYAVVSGIVENRKADLLAALEGRRKNC